MCEPPVAGNYRAPNLSWRRSPMPRVRVFGVTGDPVLSRSGFDRSSRRPRRVRRVWAARWRRCRPPTSSHRVRAPATSRASTRDVGELTQVGPVRGEPERHRTRRGRASGRMMSSTTPDEVGLGRGVNVDGDAPRRLRGDPNDRVWIGSPAQHRARSPGRGTTRPVSSPPSPCSG